MAELHRPPFPPALLFLAALAILAARGGCNAAMLRVPVCIPRFAPFRLRLMEMWKTFFSPGVWFAEMPTSSIRTRIDFCGWCGQAGLAASPVLALRGGAAPTQTTPPHDPRSSSWDSSLRPMLDDSSPVSQRECRASKLKTEKWSEPSPRNPKP